MPLNIELPKKTIATFCRKLPKVIYSKSKANELVAEKKREKNKKVQVTPHSHTFIKKLSFKKVEKKEEEEIG